MYMAASLGDLERVKALLENGAEVNARDMDGLTVLHHAASDGRIDIVRLLIERGADVNAMDEEGRTPLYPAICGITVK